MLDSVREKVLSYFEDQNSVIAMTDYDLLLVHKEEKISPQSYYIWRANSNQRIVKSAEETVLACNDDQLFLYARNAPKVDITLLNTNFATSNMVISTPLTIVFTFSNGSR
jgi:hypothetical protein